MALVGGILAAIGSILTLVYFIILLIKAFQTSVLWGIGCLLFSPLMFVFVFMNWQLTKKPFLMWVVGLILMVVGLALVAPTLAQNMPADLQNNMPAIETR